MAEHVFNRTRHDPLPVEGDADVLALVGAMQESQEGDPFIQQRPNCTINLTQVDANNGMVSQLHTIAELYQLTYSDHSDGSRIAHLHFEVARKGKRNSRANDQSICLCTCISRRNFRFRCICLLAYSEDSSPVQMASTSPRSMHFCGVHHRSRVSSRFNVFFLMEVC